MRIAKFTKSPIVGGNFKKVTALNSKFMEGRDSKEKRNLLKNFDLRYRNNLTVWPWSWTFTV